MKHLKFIKVIQNKNDYIKNILKEKIITPEKPKKNKKIKQKQKNKKEEKYCICGNQTQKNEWVGCDNNNGKCPGNCWYHLACIPELKNYNLATFNNHFTKYYCPKCRELFKLENIINRENEVNEINVQLNDNENINISINNNEISSINNNNNLELKKQESNVVEYVDINNDESKKEENNNGECPMNIEEELKDIKVEDKTKNENIMS